MDDIVVYISKDYEEKLPNFNSHEEAVNHFKEMYDDRLHLVSSNTRNGRKAYYYAIIHNKDLFWEHERMMEERGYVEGRKYMDSYQHLKIYEDGEIEVDN
ncbi:hypothetical protein LF817_19145 [Halobacillus sp. A1]|uniref:hypothetical protein n=1 Tax=Halobacillus sp. A1 TaxID=2880262 RepID=UPI0020A6A8E3|nr:hypothetical protein [Halobacillus sp. A1]MCP3033445.1 hypothetical protein [Halobacillus sp. A1]